MKRLIESPMRSGSCALEGEAAATGSFHGGVSAANWNLDVVAQARAEDADPDAIGWLWERIVATAVDGNFLRRSGDEGFHGFRFWRGTRDDRLTVFHGDSLHDRLRAEEVGFAPWP